MASLRDDAIAAIVEEMKAVDRRLRAARTGTVDTRSDSERYRAELEDDLSVARRTLAEDDLAAAAAAPARATGEGLAIVVGHTVSAPGVVGTAPPFPAVPADARQEHAWNRDLAAAMARRAAARGIRAKVFLRDGGGTLGAYARVRRWAPGAAIELHFNAGDGRLRGTETRFSHAASRPFAAALQDEMVSLFGRSEAENRGLKRCRPGERGFLGLDRFAPSALVEPFYGDEEEDAELGCLMKPRLAEALLAAFARWARAGPPRGEAPGRAGTGDRW